MYVVFCFLDFGCQYQCNWLPGKTRLQNDLLCVEWDVKPYTLAHLAYEIYNASQSDNRLLIVYCIDYDSCNV